VLLRKIASFGDPRLYALSLVADSRRAACRALRRVACPATVVHLAVAATRLRPMLQWHLLVATSDSA